MDRARYLRRAIERTLTRAARQFPAVILTGPRQSGKTTVLQMLFGKSHAYVSLDLPETQVLAQRDPRLFLDANRPPVIIDEIQHAPGLLPYIKDWIDRHRDRRGMFLITGSQSFPLMAGVTESLAGRVAVLELLTMSAGEQDGRGSTAVIPPRKGGGPEARRAMDVARLFLRGGFPELIVDKKIQTGLWYSGYLRTYLERDVRQLRQVGSLVDFQRMMVMLASRTGQLLNISDMARDLGVSVNTLKAWMSVLEAGHQIAVLRPYYANVSKRLVKTPKVYFLDNGLLCHLLGVHDERGMLGGLYGGPLFENAVFNEIVRVFTSRGRRPQVHFFRTSDGHEVDFILELGERLVPLEAKASATPRVEMARGISKLQEMLGKRVTHGWVVTLGGESVTPLVSKCTAISFSTLVSPGVATRK